MFYLSSWFEWNGTRSTDVGVYVSDLPPVTIPLERSKQTVIPGRAGSLTTLEGDNVYDDLTLTAKCWIRDPALIPSVAAWLKGEGTVTFANRPGGFYHARISNQIPFDKILRGSPHCSFAVNFRCSPPVLVPEHSGGYHRYRKQLHPGKSRYRLFRACHHGIRQRGYHTYHQRQLCGAGTCRRQHHSEQRHTGGLPGRNAAERKNGRRLSCTEAG